MTNHRLEKNPRPSRLLTGWHWTACGLWLTALSLGWRAFSPDPEPVYAGKPVSQWLNEGQEDVSFALHEIGPPAMPYILGKLAREDPESAAYRFSNRWRRMVPSPLRRILPQPATATFDETRASMALLELGPKIIPELARELRHNNPACRSVSAEVLESWRERGKDITVAVPFLRAALRDPDPRVARWAARALDTPLLSAHE